MLLLTDAPKDITSPPSPSDMLSPLNTISPLTVNVFDTFTSTKLPELDVTMLAVTFPVAAKFSPDWVPIDNEFIVRVSIPPVEFATRAAPFLTAPGVTFRSATSLPPPIFITSLVSELAPMNRLLDWKE